jgi:hypothetical protein
MEDVMSTKMTDRKRCKICGCSKGKPAPGCPDKDGFHFGCPDKDGLHFRQEKTRSERMIENAPSLRLDTALYPDGKVPPHEVRERRVVWNLMKHLLFNGHFTVDKVSYCQENVKVSSPKEAMELIFNLEEAYVYFSNTLSNESHWVRLNIGNDLEIVTDWRARWSRETSNADGFNAAMKKFDAEAYA